LSSISTSEPGLIRAFAASLFCSCIDFRPGSARLSPSLCALDTRNAATGTFGFYDESIRLEI
jgi:hypothetical protein